VNDFLMAAASATTGAQAEAEVPSSSEQRLLAGEGGPLDSIVPVGTDSSGPAEHAPARVSPTVKPVLTANPNRTKAPARQEVNR
jgi:hypothetical protein